MKKPLRKEVRNVGACSVSSASSALLAFAVCLVCPSRSSVCCLFRRSGCRSFREQGAKRPFLGVLLPAAVC